MRQQGGANAREREKSKSTEMRAEKREEKERRKERGWLRREKEAVPGGEQRCSWAQC